MYSRYDRTPVKAEASSNGIGFFGLLFIVFLTLKLTDVITWSWWWVTAPLWGPPAFVFGVAAIGFSIWGLFSLFKRKKK